MQTGNGAGAVAESLCLDPQALGREHYWKWHGLCNLKARFQCQTSLTFSFFSNGSIHWGPSIQVYESVRGSSYSACLSFLVYASVCSHYCLVICLVACISSVDRIQVIHSASLQTRLPFCSPFWQLLQYRIGSRIELRECMYVAAIVSSLWAVIL